MDLIHELINIQNWIRENTICGCYIYIAVEHTEIKIDIHITCGWDSLTDITQNYNACDWETNKNNAENLVRNFDYKNYANVTVDNWKTYIGK